VIPDQGSWRRHLKEVLKSPIVNCALACAVLAAVGAPLFALSDLI
jgi:hypothetical protein